MLLIGALCCLAVDADPATDSDKTGGLLIPDKKELAMEDQSPAENKHWWWFGKEHDWDKKKYGEHREHGENWEGKHKKLWWWKWY